MATQKLKATEWSATHSADNATATATKAAVSGVTYYVTALAAGFSATASAPKSVVLYDGATEIMRTYLTVGEVVTFTTPVRLTEGNKAEAILAASGTGGTVGHVSIMGYQEGNV